MPSLTTLTTPLGSDAYGDEILVFRQLAGSDGLSTLFDYTLTAHSTRADIGAEALLGKAVTLTLLDQYAKPRYLHALVQQFHWRGRDNRFHLYEIKLVPWLWLGHCNQDCRIFQQQTVVQIIDEVLAKYPYSIHKKLFDTYPPLSYCVQYNETDFAFVSRLMEAAGIYYFFAHTADAHTLVLCDYASAHGQLPGHAAIPFCAPDRIGLAREETIHEWRPQQGLKSGRHVTDDYDFTQPHARLQQRRQDP